MTSTTNRRLRAVTLTLLVTAGTASAQVADHEYNIPAEDLGSALQVFARQSGGHIIVSAELVAGRECATVSGTMSEKDALAHLLNGSGLHADLVAGTYVVRRDRPYPVAQHSQSDDIVVTGTRIRGSGPIGSPLITIDRGAIEKSGRATVADYLQTLPQNFGGDQNEGNYGINPNAGGNQNYGSSIDLRGLGTTSTLVLFDGNRPALGGSTGSFVDTSLIPTTAIDRIEILTDGASAIYGTDAVAGVVNIRFRDHLDGFETHVYSGAAGGAYAQKQLAQAAGKRWSTGGVMLAYQYDHHSSLPGADRAVSTEDLRPWGGPDLRSPYTLPATIIAADGSLYGIPAGQNGRNLSAASLLPGVQYLQDRRKEIDLLPEQTTHSLYAAFDQKLGDGVSLYGRALYAHRSFSSVFPVQLQSPVTVPTNNPFYVDPIGTHQPVDVEYDFQPELGRYYSTGSLDAVTTSAGARAHRGPWTLEASGAYGYQVQRETEHNGTSDARIATALADTDASTALNVFGDGQANGATTLAFIRATRGEVDRYQVWSASLRADGPLISLPAGDVRLATGYEHRDERFSSDYRSDADSGEPGAFIHEPTAGTPGHRSIEAVYAELSVPVFGPSTDHLPGRLDLSGAARADWYSDVGRTINPKVGLRWEPVMGVAFRSSFGTSFRAPGFTENPGTLGNAYEALPIPDPQSPTGQTAVIAQIGYPAKIDPEKSRSWTAGVDLKPSWLPGVTLTASYFDIHYRNRITFLSTDYASYLVQRNVYASLTQENPSAATVASLFSLDNFVNPFAIAPSAIGAIIDVRVHNLAEEQVRGVDFDLEATRPLLGGTASAGISGSRLLALNDKVDSAAPVDDVLGTIHHPVKLRLRGHIGWSGHGVDLSLMPNYVGGYANNSVLPVEHVKSWTTVDAQIGYTFASPSPLKGARIGLSAVNLFNRRPPYVYNSYFGWTLAFDPDQANAIGREIAVQATFSW